MKSFNISNTLLLYTNFILLTDVITFSLIICGFLNDAFVLYNNNIAIALQNVCMHVCEI